MSYKGVLFYSILVSLVSADFDFSRLLQGIVLLEVLLVGDLLPDPVPVFHLNILIFNLELIVFMHHKPRYKELFLFSLPKTIILKSCHSAYQTIF